MNGRYALEDPIARFWAKVKKTNSCWEWQGLLSLGYGHFFATSKKRKLAHRHAWELTNGPIPDGLCCLHKCDNRRCVNPDHIFIGTKGDNNRDMFAKGRNVVTRGNDRKTAKLNPEKVREIRKQIDAGRSNAAIGRDFGVGYSAIRAIRFNQTWTHVV